MPYKYFKLPPENKPLAKIFSKDFSISPFLAEILVNRGYTNSINVSNALNIDELNLDLVDIDVAANTINDAIDNGQKIAIYGDYDCDGITATAILYRYLHSIGAIVTYYIPDRFDEGYGLNCDAIKKLHNQNVNLIITVDTGITAINEIDYAQSLGMKVIISDHHQPLDILPNCIIVNPHRKDCNSQFKNICGALVALKLVAAIEGNIDFAIDEFADIATIGTIGDIVPMISENRFIVTKGISMLPNTSCVGLSALFAVAEVEPQSATAMSLAFTIIPRLNAAGRMGDAKLALDLLLEEDYDKAVEIAKNINDLNNQRKICEKDILTDIECTLENNPELLNKRVLVLKGEDWFHGVIGIICSKLVAKYSMPCIIVSRDDNGTYSGSGRSIENFNIFEAISHCKSTLVKYGGHKLAAGLTLKAEMFESFIDSLDEYASEACKIMPQFTYNIDKVVTVDELTIENIQSLKLLEPFGANNAEPLFLLRTKIDSIHSLSNGKHSRLICENITALYFSMSSKDLIYKVGDKVDIVCNANIDKYNGKTSVIVKIKDIRIADFSQEKFFGAKAYYKMHLLNEAIETKILKNITPSKDDCTIIYKILKSRNGFEFDIDNLYLYCMKDINYCKMRIILDIFAELGLINMSLIYDTITINNIHINLQNSKILNKLQQNQII